MYGIFVYVSLHTMYGITTATTINSTFITSCYRFMGRGGHGGSFATDSEQRKECWLWLSCRFYKFPSSFSLGYITTIQIKEIHFIA
jgi:hypothetical protein